ncbi:MAG TPA: (2Fe-2S) ferredoxin domain-containing protein [Firmicutes bacterium]|nr:(2Fe-2S) ferredoxin domain-containing protein [Bacillota bacterium]
MERLSRAELQRHRENERNRRRAVRSSNILITVSMGTSGIASGAQKTMDAIADWLQKEGVTDAVLKKTGSLGLDFAEPTVEISMPGMPTVIYGHVDAKMAEKIVKDHIKGRKLLDGCIYDRPAVDIVEEQGVNNGI